MLLERRIAEKDCSFWLHPVLQQNLTFTVSRTNMVVFSFWFLFAFCKHLQMFSIWMLGTLYIILLSKMKKKNIVFSPIHFSCSPVHRATPHSVWQPQLSFFLAAYKSSTSGCCYHTQSLRKSLCITTYLHC